MVTKSSAELLATPPRGSIWGEQWLLTTEEIKAKVVYAKAAMAEINLPEGLQAYGFGVLHAVEQRLNEELNNITNRPVRCP